MFFELTVRKPSWGEPERVPCTHRTAVLNPPDIYNYIIESLDSCISRDELDSPMTQYIIKAGISHVKYTITHCKHHHRVLPLISNRISV